MNIFKRALLILFVFGLLLPIYGQLPQNPNIVLIVCDDLNDFEGFFNSYPQSQTPNINQLAAEGVIFSNAHSNAPICGPSRSSFMTGIYPHNSSNYGFENWYNQTRSGYTINSILENSKTLMQYLKDNGYETYRAGKIMHHDLDASETSEWTETGPSAWPGPVPYDSSAGNTVCHQSVPNTFFEGAGNLNSLFAPLSNIPIVNGQSGWWTAGWQSAGAFNYVNDDDRDDLQDEKMRKWAVDDVINTLAQSDPTGENEKFFLAIGFHRPHTPLVVPQKYFDRFPIESIELPERIENDIEDCFFDNNFHQNTSTRLVYKAMVDSVNEASVDGTVYATKEAFIKAYLQAYLACVNFVDEQVGAVIDAIDASPYADNTIIIFTSDHGYEFGEKEVMSKNTLWANSTHVPFIIRAPNNTANQGKIVSHPTSLIDLYPTVRELCGLTTDTKKNSNGRDLDGYSLVPFLLDPDIAQWNGPSHALSMVSGDSSDDPNNKSFSVVSENWRYILYQNGDEELYNISNDPNEFNNLINANSAEVLENYQSLQMALFDFVPELKNKSTNLLMNGGFESLKEGTSPDSSDKGSWNDSGWYTFNNTYPSNLSEGNSYSFNRDNIHKKEGSYSLSFSQTWDNGVVVQDMKHRFKSGTVYHASFWMMSLIEDNPNSNNSLIDIEIWTSPTKEGSYTYQGTIISNAENSTENAWQQFQGSFDTSGFGAYDEYYMQLRINKKNGGVIHEIHVDNVILKEFPNNSYKAWAIANNLYENSAYSDFDKDQESNLNEFIFAGNPLNAEEKAKQISIVSESNSNQITYTRRSNLNSTVNLLSTDSLANPNWEIHNPISSTTTSLTDNNFSEVQVEFNASGNAQFFKLSASEN